MAYSGWYQKHKTDQVFMNKKREYERVYAKTPKSRYSDAKHLAKRRKFEFTLTYQEYEQLILQNCHYCGRMLNSTSAGLDRVDNARGYVSTNVVPCCWECNMIKGSTLTYNEAKETINFLTNYRNKR